MKNTFAKKFSLIFLSVIILSACASEEKPATKAHESTWINDYFVIDQGMPVRETKEGQEFFFKKCDLDSRKPHTGKAEYSCNPF